MNDFSRSSELLFKFYLLMIPVFFFIEGTCFNYISKIVNKEFKNISIWLEANKLTINNSKLNWAAHILYNFFFYKS